MMGRTVVGLGTWGTGTLGIGTLGTGILGTGILGTKILEGKTLGAKIPEAAILGAKIPGAKIPAAKILGIGMLGIGILGSGILGGIRPALAGETVPLRSAPNQFYTLSVTSPQDGPIAPDQHLTLREAIALTNGDLTLGDLSTAEQAQVTSPSTASQSEIQLNLPPGATLTLQSLLPPLRQPGLLLKADRPMTLAPAQPFGLPWGLLVLADGITVEGLGFRGFGSPQSSLYPFVGAVVVTQGQMLYDLDRLDSIAQTTPPKNLRLVGNQFQGNAFGVVLFEASHATLTGNQFLRQSGSAVITGKLAEGLRLERNVFWANGSGPQGDAVRLEGTIDGATLTQNTFCQNPGTALFLFKPEGSIAVTDNLFYGNGGWHEDWHEGLGQPWSRNFKGNLRAMEPGADQSADQDADPWVTAISPDLNPESSPDLNPDPAPGLTAESLVTLGDRASAIDRAMDPMPLPLPIPMNSTAAAIYLMGSGHQITHNLIYGQAGPGVAVAGYPRSIGNRIQNNRFAHLQGLSIDLVTRQATDPQAYRLADGPNPPRQSHNRRSDTGNGAVQTPQFVGSEFFPFGTTVTLSGTADPGVTVDLYRVLASPNPWGSLGEPVSQTTSDDEGKYTFVLETWQLGDRFSAIATHGEDGTSEPAPPVLIRSYSDPHPPWVSQETPLPSLPPPCQEVPPP